MDFSLDEQHTTVTQLAAQILRDSVTSERLDNVAGARDGRAWTALADAGLLGVSLPERAGGSGLGFLGAHCVLVEIGRTAALLPYLETIVLGAMPVAAFGTASQRQRWLARVLTGDVVLTAIPDDGPDAGTPTTARRVGEGWVLEGHRTTVSWAPESSAILVPAATEEGHAGVWIVPTESPRLTVRPQAVITGAPTGEVSLDGVAVAPDALLGDLDGRVNDWLAAHAAAGLASMTAGLCAAAVRLAADYTSTREQFGRPVATFQAVAQRVADAYIDAQAVELTALQAAWRLSEGLPAADEVAIAKWWASDAGHRVIHAAAHVHGGVGVDRSYPLHRYFSAIKHLEFLGGSAPVHLQRLGASLAAEPA